MEGTRLLLLDAANEGLLLLFFFTFFFSSFFLWLTSPSVGLKTVGNDREIPQTVPAPVFFIGDGNGNGIDGRENETDITGYRERNMSVGNMSITIGNR